MLVLLTVDAVLMSLHPENGSCCMPCVHYAISQQVLSLDALLSTGMYTPCMSVYTVTVLHTVSSYTASHGPLIHCPLTCCITWSARTALHALLCTDMHGLQAPAQSPPLDIVLQKWFSNTLCLLVRTCMSSIERMA